MTPEELEKEISRLRWKQFWLIVEVVCILILITQSVLISYGHFVYKEEPSNYTIFNTLFLLGMMIYCDIKKTH